MEDALTETPARKPDRPDDRRRVLVFCRSATSGPARRMDSLIAHFARTRRAELRVVTVDVDMQPELRRRLAVEQVPCLVLLEAGRELGRIEGRATGSRIDDLLARPPA